MFKEVDFDNKLAHSHWLGVTQQQDADDCINILKKEKIDWLIVDHYAIDEDWQCKLKPYYNKLMVIDDLANRRHQCDVLIDANFVKGYSQRYENLVKTSCAALLGPDYCLISHEYNNPDLLLRESSGLVGRVLLYFGGVDQFNLSGLCLDVFSIDELKHIDLDIVIGAMNQNHESLSIAGVKRGKTTLHSSIPHLAKLINSADLALGAGGVTTWERMYLGLPSMIISIAENQVLGAETLSENKFATYLGFHTEITKKSLANAITAKISNSSEILQESLAGKKLVDGKGVFRIINCMTSF